MTGQSITRAARADFSPEQVRLLKRTVAKQCNDDEFVYFLEVAAFYNLNPLVGEVYAAKMAGANGEGGRVAILIGRNGYLKMARSQSHFRGIDGDVVRKNDVFKVKRSQGGREVIHEYEGDTAARGEIVGAWSEVYRDDESRPYYFFAPMHEYRPTNEKKLRYSPWGSQESVMIQKCAYVGALRIAFNISGVYEEAEMARAQERGIPDAPTEEIEWGDDADVANRLRATIAKANEIRDGYLRPAKLLMRLNGKTDEERIAFCEEVEKFIVSQGHEVPEPPIEGEIVGEEQAA